MTIINIASNLASRTVVNIANTVNKNKNSVKHQSNKESDFIIFCIFCIILLIFMWIPNKNRPEQTRTN